MMLRCPNDWIETIVIQAVSDLKQPAMLNVILKLNWVTVNVVEYKS